MADSVDRVFVHALNTVKRIPRLGSARPPPSERLKLYGLYKQSMEGNVEGVMDRPGNDSSSSVSEELRADQQKWDAWHAQRGLSRTEAKRRYITTLIETMRVYANQTPDARELVSELEFVWDQIKSNPASSSSGRSHSNSNPNSTSQSSQQHQGESPRSTSDRQIYPLMSDRGSRHPRVSTSQKRGRDSVEVEGTDAAGLRVLSPMSQRDGGVEYEDSEEDERQGVGRAGDGDQYGAEDDTEGDFVDAPDSQMAEGDRGQYASSAGDNDLESQGSPEGQRHPPDDPPAPPRSAAQALIEPIAKYLQKQTSQLQPSSRAGAPDGNTLRWQRRIESALSKMNAEMAALREQLDMQQQQHGAGSVYSAIVQPFNMSRRSSFAGPPGGRPKLSVFAWLLDAASSFARALLRHALFDAALLVLVMLWLHYRGIPPERLEELMASWIRRVRSLALFRRLNKVRAGEANLPLPRALQRRARAPPSA